jgi:hypothetical protein
MAKPLAESGFKMGGLTNQPAAAASSGTRTTTKSVIWLAREEADVGSGGEAIG